MKESSYGTDLVRWFIQNFRLDLLRLNDVDIENLFIDKLTRWV